MRVHNEAVNNVDRTVVSSLVSPLLISLVEAFGVREVCSELPLNFLGGLPRSPASGWTTHRSSTNLKNQSRSQFYTCSGVYIYGEGCLSGGVYIYIW